MEDVQLKTKLKYYKQYFKQPEGTENSYSRLNRIQYKIENEPTTKKFKNKFKMSKSICDYSNKKDTFVTLNVRKAYDDSTSTYGFNLGFFDYVTQSAPE